MASVVIYARVSTEEGQDTAAQVRVCQEYAERHGYTVHQVYEDHTSAVNFRGRRAWRTMLADLKRWHPRTRPKAILAYALDRVIRSMLDYVNITEQLKTLDVALVTADGTLGEIGDPGDPYREFMAGVLALFAQLERKIIIRRTRDGIKNAQAKGVQFGRPRREIDWAAWEALPEGLSTRQRAKALGVPPTTGEFTFQVQHLVVKGLGRRAVAEALAGGIVVQLDDLRKGLFRRGQAGRVLRGAGAVGGRWRSLRPPSARGSGYRRRRSGCPGHGGGSGGRTRCRCRR